jgi:hypothetical protein
LRGVEKIDWIIAIGHDIALESESLEKFSLHLRSCGRHGGYGLGSDRLDHVFELGGFDFSEFLGSLDFKFGNKFLMLEENLILFHFFFDDGFIFDFSRFGHFFSDFKVGFRF